MPLLLIAYMSVKAKIPHTWHTWADCQRVTAMKAHTSSAH